MANDIKSIDDQVKVLVDNIKKLQDEIKTYQSGYKAFETASAALEALAKTQGGLSDSLASSLKTLEKIDNGTGIVVGTNLLNYATPIIRYWQGDLVTIDSNSQCECGHNGRILTSIHGREMDSFISNGKEIPASAFMDIAYNWF